MSDSTTLTVRLSTQAKDQLAELAARTQRTRSFLAAEAITAYVARELATVEAIQQGWAEAEAGLFIAHEDVMRDMRAVIEETANTK